MITMYIGVQSQIYEVAFFLFIAQILNFMMPINKGGTILFLWDFFWRLRIHHLQLVQNCSRIDDILTWCSSTFYVTFCVLVFYLTLKFEDNTCSIRSCCGGAWNMLLLHQAVFPQTALQGWKEGHEGCRPQVRPALRLSLQGKGTVYFTPTRIQRRSRRGNEIANVATK